MKHSSIKRKFSLVLVITMLFTLLASFNAFAATFPSDNEMFEENHVVIGTHYFDGLPTMKQIMEASKTADSNNIFYRAGVNQDTYDVQWTDDAMGDGVILDMGGKSFTITHKNGKPIEESALTNTGIAVKSDSKSVVSLDSKNITVPTGSTVRFLKSAITSDGLGGTQKYEVLESTGSTTLVEDDTELANTNVLKVTSEDGTATAEYTITVKTGGGGAELTEQQKVSIAYDAVRKGNYKDLPVTEETQDLKTAAVQKQVNTLITEAFKVKARAVSDVVATVAVDGTTYKVEIKCGETKDNFDIKDATFKVGAEVPTDTPTFTTDLNTETVTYDKKNSPTVTPLTVLATVADGGTISYQWYKNGTAIAGATDTSYTPSIETLETATYHVVATNTKDGKTATATSKTATIKTVDSDLPNAEVPTITTNLSTTDTVYNVGDSAVLTVVAEVTDSGTLSYQWYKNNAAIANANLSTYTVDTTKKDEATYYVQITNTKTGTNPSVVESNKLKVTVQEKALEKLTVTFSSNDTSKGTVEAHVYDSDNKETIVTNSPADVVSGSKVVLLAKPTSDNVLDTWNNDNTEVTYTIEEVTANETVTANFIVKDKTPLAEAISGADAYAKQISDGVILVEANDTTADKVEKDKKFVLEIERDALITGLGLADKLYKEVSPVVIETKNDITTATQNLKDITDTFNRLIKTGTKPVATTKYTVTGGVYGENVSTPLSGAIVKVTDQVYNTNSEGLYTITNVTDGTYNLEISKENYGTKTVTLTVSGTTVTASGATVTVSGNNITVSDVILTNVINDKLLKATVTKVVYDNTTLTDAAEISVVTDVYGEVIDAVYTENSKVKFTFSAATDRVSDVKITGIGNDGSTPITPATFAGTPTYNFTLENISLSDLISEDYRIKIELTVNDNNQPLTTYQNASTKVTYFVKFEQKSSN